MGAEPAEVNVTTSKTGEKWSQWNGYNDPTGSVVGAYEGARYFDAGLYRPTEDSKMRTLGQPFNAVSREKIILDIYNIVRPLDMFTSNATPLMNPLSVSDTRVDKDTINTQWFLDGMRKPVFDDKDTFTFGNLGLSAGLHTLRLHAYDPTGFDPTDGWVRINTGELEQDVTWNVMVNVPEPATLALAAIGFVLLEARRRLTVRGRA
jgi:hypothetical protein